MSETVHALRDDALANTAHVVEVGGGEAVVIDPPRDVDAVLALAARLGVRVVASFDTHLHADYVSGTTELVARGAQGVTPRAANVSWAHRDVTDGDALTFGEVTLRALATPGHTPEHLAYILETKRGPRGVFTGGSLILGGAARTDLLGPERTDTLARAQFHSLRRLAELPGDVAVYPTHGAGSFCLATAAAVENPTVASERATNPLLAIDDEDEFVDALVQGFGSFPTYYRDLQAINRAGPRPLASLGQPRLLAPLEAAARIADGAWLVDARPIHEWATGHPTGAVSDELRPAFASWLGWAVPFGSPVVVLVDDDQRDEVTRLARRIGYDDVSFLDGDLDAWRTAGLGVSTVAELGPCEARDRQRTGSVLLDVRQRAELDTVRIPGAEHLELGDIIAGATPQAADVITFCGHGERSATAASLLEQRGVHVANLVGGTAAWLDAGLPVET